MKTSIVFLSALALWAPALHAETLTLEGPDPARDRVLAGRRAERPGELEPASTEQRRRWQEQAARLLQNRFPTASRGVRVEVTPLGIMRLTGRVPDLATKLAMAQTVMDSPGVGLMVDNALEAAVGERDDAAIQADIRRRFAAQPMLGPLDVTVNDQAVTLPRSLASDPARANEALRVAAAVRGVRDVAIE